MGSEDTASEVWDKVNESNGDKQIKIACGSDQDIVLDKVELNPEDEKAAWDTIINTIASMKEQTKGKGRGRGQAKHKQQMGKKRKLRDSRANVQPEGKKKRFSSSSSSEAEDAASEQQNSADSTSKTSDSVPKTTGDSNLVGTERKGKGESLDSDKATDTPPVEKKAKLDLVEPKSTSDDPTTE